MSVPTGPPDQVAANEIWIGTIETPTANGYYQADSLTYAQLAQFIRKMTIGDATKDSDDYISTKVYGNFTGGGQVEEENEGAETDRFWTGFADTTSANRNGGSPLVTAVRPNANCTDCYPLDVGNDGIMYLAFNESGTWEVWGFNETSGAFDYNSGAGVALGGIPVGKAIRFDGVIYVPLGATGYSRITGSAGVPSVTTVSGAADPTTADPTSAPRPLCFTILYQRLWCITATGGIAYHTIAQKDAGSNAWHWPVGTTDTDFPHIEASATPKATTVFPDKSGVESVYVKTDRGLIIFDDNNPVFIETHVEFPPHPDINQSLAIWPPGGDLHAPVGLNDVKYSTAFVVDPYFGLARDHGLPATLRGAMTDIEPTIDRLWAIVGGVLEVTSGYVYNDTVGSSGTGNGEFADARGVAVHPSTGNVYVADEDNDRIQIFDAALTYDGQFGSSGTGDGELDSPTQIAFDGSGNLYVADGGNNRVQKFNGSGVYQAKTSIPGSLVVRGCCVDSTGNVYVTAQVSGPSADIVKLDSSLVITDTESLSTVQGFVHIATDSTHLYIVRTDNTIRKHRCSDLGFVSSWGSTGSGDGQFQAPHGIAVNPVTGNVFVSDTIRDDVQEFTSTGDYVRKLGTSGSSNGQFNAPTGIAFNAAGTSVYIADATNDDLQEFISNTGGALTAYPSLHAWTGVGWHGMWKGSDLTAVPHWLKAGNATGAYRLWWGMDDGYAYHLKLRRTFHNARTGFLAGIDEFAETSYIETGFFDAAMEGFDKIASHLTFLDAVCTDTETITVEYKVDSGGWQALGTITASANKQSLPFDVVDGFSRGVRFNKIAFRFTWARGSNIHATALLDAATLHFTKIPQNTTSFQLGIPLSEFRGRTPFEQYNDLTALVTVGEFLPLVHRRDSYDSDGNLIPATFRVLIAANSGVQDTGTGGQARTDLSIIAIPDGT